MLTKEMSIGLTAAAALCGGACGDRLAETTGAHAREVVAYRGIIPGAGAATVDDGDALSGGWRRHDIRLDTARGKADANDVDQEGAPAAPADRTAAASPAAQEGSEAILARINAAQKGRDILYTVHFDTKARLRMKFQGFLAHEGMIMEEDSDWFVDVTTLEPATVGAATSDDGGANLDYRGTPPPKTKSLYVRLAATGVMLLPNEGGPPLTVDVTDITFDCGSADACERLAEDFGALIAAVKAERSDGVEIAGLWELYAPSPSGDFSRWTLDFKRDGSYVFIDNSTRASHKGRYSSSAGKWSLSGTWTQNALLPDGATFDDGGAYRFIASDALELRGRYGAGVWRKSADR